MKAELATWELRFRVWIIGAPIIATLPDKSVLANANR